MIVIPMAGLSSRFAAAGYQAPKYMLPLGGKTVFDHAVGSFRAYFETEPFLFIARDIAGTAAFLAASCEALGIKQHHVELLDQSTAGQAETVELGLEQAGVQDATAITIFNIDTFRPGFCFPSGPWRKDSAGYLEVFQGSGTNWSYVRTKTRDSNQVIETAEKREISNLCCTGLYHFTATSDFRNALTAERVNPSAPELYVAPLYNHVIAAGRDVHCEIVPTSAVVFCGVPMEYEALLKVEGGTPHG